MRSEQRSLLEENGREVLRLFRDVDGLQRSQFASQRMRRSRKDTAEQVLAKGGMWELYVVILMAEVEREGGERVQAAAAIADFTSLQRSTQTFKPPAQASISRYCCRPRRQRRGSGRSSVCCWERQDRLQLACQPRFPAEGVHRQGIDRRTADAIESRASLKPALVAAGRRRRLPRHCCGCDDCQGVLLLAVVAPSTAVAASIL